MWFRVLIACAAVCVLAAVVTGCSVVGGSRQALDGTEWVLTSWSDSTQDPTAFRITARFSDGQVGGTSGVNAYGAPYRTGFGGRFSVGEVSTTLMAGPEPAMRAEATYVRLLGEARAYALGEDRLALLDADGSELLVFAPAR